MAQKDARLAEFLVEYTIELLPDVKDEDFEFGRALLRDAGFSLTQAHFGSFDLEHRFLRKVRSKDQADRYVWQIRIFDVGLIGSTTEDNMFDRLHEEVSRTLASIGIPGSRTILREIAAFESQ